MDYQFVPMTREYARTIVEGWKYGGESSIYDYSNEADHMLDPAAWEAGILAVLDEAGELVGEVSIEFLDESDQYTEYGEFGDSALISSREMWIGFGMRPDLVGRKLGPGFVRACVRHAVRCYGYRGEYVRLGVATFNRRAIKAYERAGFEVYDQARGLIAGREYDSVYMRRRLQAE